MKKAVSSVVCFIFLVFSTFGYGVGFYNPDQAAKPQGMANAFVAQADDPSAAYFNPAGIVWLDSYNIQLGGMGLIPDIEYTAPDGTAWETQDDFFFMPSLYFTANIPNTSFWASLSFNVPFGLGTDWGMDSFARFVAPDSELTMFNINPSLAYKVNDKFSVAAGVDYYSSELNNYQDTVLGPAFGIPDMTISTMHLNVDGAGWGWNAAAMFKPAEKHSLGISYRSEVNPDLDGDVTIRNLPPALGMGSEMSLDASVEFKYPAMVKGGYAYKPNDKWTFEFDIDWLNWSNFDQIVIDLNAPGFSDITSVRDWDDSFIYAVGTQYNLNEKWALRAGYAFAETPVPEATFIPDIPRNDMNVLSVGAGYNGGKWRLDAAYTAIISEDRDIANAVGAPFASINGNYDSFMSVVGLSFTYAF
jgi:long-chain fatty acid transport protein